MGRHTPFVGGGGKCVKTAWMREMEFLCLDFFGALSGGRTVFMVSGRRGGQAGRASMGGRGASEGGAFAMVCVICFVCDVDMKEDHQVDVDK
jgi:hypothetical protein